MAKKRQNCVKKINKMRCEDKKAVQTVSLATELLLVRGIVFDFTFL